MNVSSDNPETMVVEPAADAAATEGADTAAAKPVRRRRTTKAAASEAAATESASAEAAASPSPVTEAVAPEAIEAAAEAPAKPARKRRTTKAAVAESATESVVAEAAAESRTAEAAAASPATADTHAAQAAAVASAVDPVAVAPVAVEPAAEPVSEHVAQAAVEPVANAAEAIASPAADPVGTAGGATATGGADEPVAEGDPATTAQGAADDASEASAERTRRRNRRERRRGRADAAAPGDAGAVGEAGEPAATAEAASPAGAGDANDERDESDADDASADDASAGPTEPATPPIAAEEVFAQVLSGEFDVEPAPGESVLPPKRVLRADPEAPKLHKVLAQAGVGSRREMEQLILDGQITVNGQPAHIGQRISFGDHIKVNGRPIKVRIMPLPPRIIAYHKPVGEVVTNDDPQHRPTVFRRLPRLQQGKWQSVGRLDLNTEGLLLFTNSGELANQLMHPRFGVEREYAVRVLGTLDEDARYELLEGVDIDGQSCSFRSIEDGGGEGANHWYRVVITEGRNREVRKLFDAVGLTVSRLIRIRYGTVVLPRGLRRGVWVDLDDADVRAIRRLANPNGDADDARGDRGAVRDKPGRNRNKRRNERGENRPDNRPDTRADNRQEGRVEPRGPRPPVPPRRPDPAPRVERPRDADDRDFDDDDEIDHSRIPNPLEQTFDKRFVQNPRTPAGGRGFRSGGGGFGAGGSAPPAPKPGKGPREPDPMQTTVSYIGADAFHRKGPRGNRSGGGGGGGGGGGAGGNRGGSGGGGFGGKRRGR